LYFCRPKVRYFLNNPRILLLSVQCINSWWWTEELSKTCRVSWQNKFVKLTHLVGFIIKKYYPGVRLKGWICKTLVRMSSLDLLLMNVEPCALKQEMLLVSPWHLVQIPHVFVYLVKCEKYTQPSKMGPTWNRHISLM